MQSKVLLNQKKKDKKIKEKLQSTNDRTRQGPEPRIGSGGAELGSGPNWVPAVELGTEAVKLGTKAVEFII